MTLTLENLQILDTEAQWFNISSEEIKEINENRAEYSNEFARNNAELNQLCLQKVLEWIEENIDPETRGEIFANVQENIQENAQLWEFVNGSVITVGKTRIVIIPSDDFDTEEITIPQEWIDIPQWVADYYLAVQVDPENNYLRIWGFTSHKTVTHKGDYDSLYRNYSLEKDYLITDLDVILLAIEMECEEKKEVIAPLPTLKLSTAQALLEKLSQSSPYSPRLEIDFKPWGALLANPQLRQQLYQQRLTKAKQQTVANISTTARKTVVNLTQWLDNNFTEAAAMGWQTFESLFSPQTPELGYRSSVVRDEDNGIKRTKIFNLKSSLGEISVILLVALIPEEDDNVGVYLELHPDPKQQYLPPKLQLFIVDEDEELESIVTGFQDNKIQSDYYVFERDSEFQVTIIFEQNHLTEKFTIV